MIISKHIFSRSRKEKIGRWWETTFCGSRGRTGVRTLLTWERRVHQSREDWVNVAPIGRWWRLWVELSRGVSHDFYIGNWMLMWSLFSESSIGHLGTSFEIEIESRLRALLGELALAAVHRQRRLTLAGQPSLDKRRASAVFIAALRIGSSLPIAGVTSVGHTTATGWLAATAA